MLDISINRDPRAATEYGRFAMLLSSDSCSRLPYDEVLLDLGECVVAPTLGSILPYWLLVVPRAPSLNFSQWRARTNVEPHRLVAATLEAYGIHECRAIWFEHGAAELGSALACGADHAHLHIIVDAPFSFDAFITAAAHASHVSWQTKSVERAYSSVDPDRSYLLAVSASQVLVAERVESVGSQFFRRVIAKLVGQPDAWNYRTHPNIENVQKTLEAFGTELTQRLVR